jgi:hypothetical protein
VGEEDLIEERAELCLLGTMGYVKVLKSSAYFSR